MFSGRGSRFLGVLGALWASGRLLVADLLACDVASFDRLDCIIQVSLEALCQVLESDVEDYKPG
jgi:hypothetical protein